MDQNYSSLRILGKDGLEVPLQMSASLKVTVPNARGSADDAVFYAVTDADLNVVGAYRQSSGARFAFDSVSGGKVVCDAVLNDSSVSFAVGAYVSRTNSSSGTAEYSLSALDTAMLDKSLKDVAASAGVPLPFPSIAFNGNLDFGKVSTGLVETQSLYLLAEDSSGNLAKMQSWDPRYELMFFIDQRSQQDFRCFGDVLDGNDEFVWSDREFVTPSADGFRVNIGFRSDQEGYFEEPLYVCLVDTSKKSESDPTDIGDIALAGKLAMRAETVGEDERYRTLFANFGIPDPKTYYGTFSDTDGADGNMDNEVLNRKSKMVFLHYSDIFPYVGSYKALINAVKVLGYEDIFFKEWYKETGKTIYDRGNVSYDIAYKSDANANTISNLPMEERVQLKKLNWLSEMYRINAQADAPDDMYGFPAAETVYGYNNADRIAKLVSLKDWLEKYVLGLNCRIIDISGEGIAFERYSQRSYGTFQKLYEWSDRAAFQPVVSDSSRFVQLEDSSAIVSVDYGMRDSSVPLSDIDGYRICDFCDGWMSPDGTFRMCDDSSSLLAIESSDDASVFTGGTFECADHLYEYSFKAKARIEDFLFSDNYVDSSSSALRVHGRRLSFSVWDASERGRNSSFTRLPVIQVERANVRRSDAAWKGSVAYSIDIDASSSDGVRYVLSDIAAGTFVKSPGLFTLVPPTWEDDASVTHVTSAAGGTWDMPKEYAPECSAPAKVPMYVADRGLRYSCNNPYSPYNMPFFYMTGYCVDGMDDFIKYAPGQEYVLEILDGRMMFVEPEYGRTVYLTFGFDDVAGVQDVDVTVAYDSDELYPATYSSEGDGTFDIVHLYDGRTYPGFLKSYLSDPALCTSYGASGSVKVYNAGTYYVDAVGRNCHNGIFPKRAKGTSEVYVLPPSVTAYTNLPNSGGTYGIDGSLCRGVPEGYSDFCMFEDCYLMPDSSVADASVTFPRYGYGVRTNVDASTGVVDFMNVSETFNVVGIVEDDRTTSLSSRCELSLERDGSAPVMKIAGDDPADDPFRGLARCSSMLDYMKLYNGTDALKYTDVEVVFLDALSNAPVYQTYGQMAKGSLVDSSCPDWEYRLGIDDDTESVYVWASLKESVLRYAQDNGIDATEDYVAAEMASSLSELSASGWVYKEIDGDVLYAVATPDDESDPDSKLYYVRTDEMDVAGKQYVGSDETFVSMDVAKLVRDKNISVHIQPTWKAPVTLSYIDSSSYPGLDPSKDYVCATYDDAKSFRCRFAPGEIVKLVFSSSDYGDYVGQCSFRVYGYDDTYGFLILEGYVNRELFDDETHNVWTSLDAGSVEELEAKFAGKDITYNETKTEATVKSVTTQFRLNGRTYSATYDLDVKYEQNYGRGWMNKIYLFNGSTSEAYPMLSKGSLSSEYSSSISYSHNAFVDYSMKAAGSYETVRGDVKVALGDPDPYVYRFIDDTFAVSLSDFDRNDARADWMAYAYDHSLQVPDIGDSSVYSYAGVPVEISKGSPVAFTAGFPQSPPPLSADGLRTYWRVYKAISERERRLLYEVHNMGLFVEPEESGLYDVEAFAYDRHGNLASRLFKGAYRAV